jgi:hypothetical protein
MRVWLLSLAAVVLGTSTGLGLTWLEFHDVHEYFQPVSLSKPAQAPVDPALSGLPAGPVAVVVGGPKFDFGTLNYDQSRDTKFTIRNDGTEALVVTWTGESCGKCIINKEEFTSVSVPPGGTCEVPVTYATKKMNTNFSEAVYLTTNDPRHNSLQLEIVGIVTMALKLDPESLTVNSLPTSELTTVDAKLFGYYSDKLELVKYELSDPSTSALIELKTQPLDAAAVQAQEHARAGLELQVHFKPGLPIGPLNQTVTITAVADMERTIALPIHGTVVGDLSIYGKGYDSANGFLNLGVIRREAGLSIEIFVLVKGPSRQDVKISVGDVDPADVLQVSVGDPTPLGDGRAIKFPVQVTIPKGAPAMNRLGNQQGKAATFVLETTHPISKRLPVTVRFAVE